VYGWIWRQLPGTTAVKTFEALLLLITVVALLLFVVFPWVEPLLPFNNTTVGAGR
jgi:accessory gene regulator protein AgrB